MGVKKKKLHYTWASRWPLPADYQPPQDGYPTDKEGEEAIRALRLSMLSEKQTQRNQRDIEKRRKKNESKY